MTGGWNGAAVRRARAHLARQLPTTCAECGTTITTTTPWVVGHTIPRWYAPHLANTPTNWQIECRDCSNSSGPRHAALKQAADLARTQGIPEPDIMGMITRRGARQDWTR